MMSIFKQRVRLNGVGVGETDMIDLMWTWFNGSWFMDYTQNLAKLGVHAHAHRSEAKTNRFLSFGCDTMRCIVHGYWRRRRTCTNMRISLQTALAWLGKEGKGEFKSPIIKSRSHIDKSIALKIVETRISKYHTF